MIESNNKIIPCIWFSADGGCISVINEYYKAIFGNEFMAGQVITLGENPGGKTEMCEVVIFGKKYNFMNTAKEHHALNDAVSFMIYCENQLEIDNYWDYFTKEGKEMSCAWCIDKYGLRWQVLPKNMGELMRKPNAFKIMMGQKKIMIDEYLK